MAQYDGAFTRAAIECGLLDDARELGLIPPAPETGLLTFSTALMLMRQGFKMSRRGYTKHNKRPKYVYFVEGTPEMMSHLLVHYPASEKYPQPVTSTWVPARCDLFEDDWFIVEAPVSVH
jgi:acyl-CoA synthetase (AMP-forming)/AMP-acid ligase II